MSKLINGWQLFHGSGGSDVMIAEDLAGKDRPKLKFFFTVKIVFRGEGARGSDELLEMDLSAKSATRPNINFEYQKVNFYNFRTSVATKTNYGVVTVTFYDDTKNKSHDIFKDYLLKVSPIASKGFNAAGALEGDPGAASIGPLENRYGIIKYMRVTQHFTDLSAQAGKKVHYDYLNPKVENFILDDLDMTVSDASSITVTFGYDSVNVVYE